MSRVTFNATFYLEIKSRTIYVKPGINIVYFKIVKILVTTYTLKSLLWAKFGSSLLESDESLLSEPTGDECDG
jgi:hypothetical protein